MSALELIGATAVLGGRTVLDGVSLSVAAGELVAVVGPNGAGKSSAIRALAGLLPLTAGQARLGGAAVAGLSMRGRAERAAYLPQERRIAWNLPAVEVAALGAPFLTPGDALQRAQAALNEVEGGHLADRGVAEMSGGERARVLLARALATGTQALLADEPTAGLDPEAQLMVLERLKARAAGGQAVLVSLHDLALAARYADRVMVLDAGRVVADAAPMAALTPGIMAKVFGLAARWVEGPDGPLLSSGRYSDGSPAGARTPSSPV
ncbi:ABC transporter ATP-binding protein [Brevundimonas sp.]|uniref:ABC transporter ATP-binding protein n=1 Tax=Brevundimonas sp. TaxID=1871086 RepID=UPI00272F4188|nr:ABC transporter ATP-binding protein [Brevundimonas sp.]MDP1911751.1 ABC transporter ATP-binding protein [Brevundimonas sp.]